MTIDKTSKGLASALFDELDELKAGNVTPQHARAFAHTAGTICAITRLEMDYARFVSEGSSPGAIEDGGSKLKALPMGSGK